MSHTLHALTCKLYHVGLHSRSKMTVVKFVFCCLDYCNSLFSISEGLMSRLQSVQNAASRLVTGTRRCYHITPVLRLLHWLPVPSVVGSRYASSLSDNLPSYLADDCRLIADTCTRERRLYAPQRTEHVSLHGPTAASVTDFAAADPGLWISLPSHLRDVDLSYRADITKDIY